MQRDSAQPLGWRQYDQGWRALLLLLLAACSDQNPLTQAVNEMIESPLQNTVISSADTYPPRPVTQADLNSQRSESVAANLGPHPVYPWTPRSKDRIP